MRIMFETQMFQKTSDMHQLCAGKVLNPRAYEKPSWHYGSQRTFAAIGACPKSGAALPVCGLRAAQKQSNFKSPVLQCSHFPADAISGFAAVPRLRLLTLQLLRLESACALVLSQSQVSLTATCTFIGQTPPDRLDHRHGQADSKSAASCR